MAARFQPDGSPQSPDDLQASVDKLITGCNGDARAAVRALIVAVAHIEAELCAERTVCATFAEAVSLGYARGRRYRRLERSENPIPYTPDS